MHNEFKHPIHVRRQLGILPFDNPTSNTFLAIHSTEENCIAVAGGKIKNYETKYKLDSLSELLLS